MKAPESPRPLGWTDLARSVRPHCHVSTRNRDRRGLCDSLAQFRARARVTRACRSGRSEGRSSRTRRTARPDPSVRCPVARRRHSRVPRDSQRLEAACMPLPERERRHLYENRCPRPRLGEALPGAPSRGPPPLREMTAFTRERNWPDAFLVAVSPRHCAGQGIARVSGSVAGCQQEQVEDGHDSAGEGQPHHD